MLKVTSLSTIFFTNPQRTSFNEEKEEERILPSTVPHIQNRMVTKTKLIMIRTSFLAIPLVMIPLSLYPLVFAISVLLCARSVLPYSTCFPKPFFVDNDDHDVPFHDNPMFFRVDKQRRTMT